MVPAVRGPKKRERDMKHIQTFEGFLMENKQLPLFNVGDRVEIKELLGSGKKYSGREGVILEEPLELSNGKFSYMVKVGNKTVEFHEYELGHLMESYSGPVGIELKNYKYASTDEFLSITLNGTKYRLLMERKFPRQATKEDLVVWKKLEQELKRLKFPTQLQYTDDLTFASQAIILNGFYEVFIPDRTRLTLVQNVDRHSLEFSTSHGLLKAGRVIYSNDRPD